jgi:hypothetical protein
LKFTTFAIILLGAAFPMARAQGNYEIQVYGSDTVAARSTMVELHSNFTADGHLATPGLAATNHAEHETIEITQGINDWTEVGFYIFTSEQSGLDVQWVGDHIRPESAYLKGGTGRLGLAFRPKSAISARFSHPTHGPGRFVPSSTKLPDAGTSRLTRHLNAPGMGPTSEARHRLLARGQDQLRLHEEDRRRLRVLRRLRQHHTHRKPSQSAATALSRNRPQRFS